MTTRLRTIVDRSVKAAPQAAANLLVVVGAVNIVVAVGTLAGRPWGQLLAGVLIAAAGWAIHLDHERARTERPRDGQAS